MLIKIIGAVCVITACTGGGMYCGRMLRLRQENLQEARRSVEFLQAIIRSEDKPLTEALWGAGRHLHGAYAKLFREIAKGLEQYDGTSVEDVWKKGTKRNLTMSYLKPTDVEQFETIGEQLGMTDRRRQENILEHYITYVNTELTVLNEEVREKTKLYRNLGILLGIFLTILLL